MTGSPAGKECDVPCERKEEETSLEQKCARGALIVPSDCVWGIVSRNSTPSLTMKKTLLSLSGNYMKLLVVFLPGKNDSHICNLKNYQYITY